MKICHIITRLIIGGAQENTLLTCEGLHARGHDVTLIAGPTAGPEGSIVPRARHGGYRYIELPHLVREINPLADLRALVDLRRLLRQLRPDVVHTHSSKAGILGRLAAVNVPKIVHTIHGMSFNRTQPYWLQFIFCELERLCAARTHWLVGVAEAMARQSLAAGIGTPEQHVTIYSGMDVSLFDPARYDRTAVRRELGVPDDAVLAATVARLFRDKGYEQLIPAMQRAAAREPRLRFLWIGDGADRHKYERELARRRLRDRTHLAGLVPPERIPPLLAGCDLLVHASRWEGLPRAVVQALLMERPAVCFDLDGAPEVVQQGVTGELVPEGEISPLADAIVHLAANPARRAAYGRAGRRLCLERFDHHRMLSALCDLYTR
jgi:glycosyltransferase involved in cell wall biosynthesis